MSLQHESALVALLPGLGVTRSLIGRALEVPVAQTSAAALEQHQTLAILGHLAHILHRRRTVLVLDHAARHGAQRHGDYDVGGILARRTRSVAALAVLGKLVALIFEVDKSPVLAVALQHYAAALAAISAVGASEGNEFLASEMTRACAAVTRAGKYLHIIDKVRTGHKYLV